MLCLIKRIYKFSFDLRFCFLFPQLSDKNFLTLSNDYVQLKRKFEIKKSKIELDFHGVIAVNYGG